VSLFMKYMNKSTFITTYGKFLLLNLIVFLLTFVTSFQVYASEADAGEPASDTASTVSYTVTGIENSEQLSNLAPFDMVRRSSQNTEPLFSCWLARLTSRKATERLWRR